MFLVPLYVFYIFSLLSDHKGFEEEALLWGSWTSNLCVGEDP